MAAPTGVTALIETPTVTLRHTTATRPTISVVPRPERPRMTKATPTQTPPPCIERPSRAGDTEQAVSKQLVLDQPVHWLNHTLLALRPENQARPPRVPSTSSMTVLVASPAHEKPHGPPIDCLTRNRNTTMAIPLHLVVTPLLSTKTVHAMSIQERPNALAQCIATKIAASSAEGSAFAVAVKTDTTTT